MKGHHDFCRQLIGNQFSDNTSNLIHFDIHNYVFWIFVRKEHRPVLWKAFWENNSNLIKKNLTIVSTHYRYGIHIIWLVMLVRSEISKVNAKDVRCLVNKCVYIWPLTIDFIRSCVTSSYIFNKLTPSSVSNLKCLYRFLSHSFSFPSIPNYSLPFLGNTHGRQMDPSD